MREVSDANLTGDGGGEAARVARRAPVTTSGPLRGPVTTAGRRGGPVARLAALACLAVLAGTAHAEVWTVTVLHPPGAAQSVAEGVDGGQQVGWTRMVGNDARASLWRGTAASWVDLHPPGAAYSRAEGVHGGVQAGRTENADGRDRAALWRGTAASWVDLHPPAARESWARAVHGDLQVGGTLWDWPVPLRAALWRGTAASWVELHPPGAGGSEAYGVHGGQQVGEVNGRAALWRGTAASWVDLHPPGASRSLAWAVHGGRQAGRTWDRDGRQRAALWSGTAASWVDLHPPGTMISTATGVHGGWQVGRVEEYSDWNTRAGVWSGTAASWRELPLPPGSWGPSGARAVGRDGNHLAVAGYAWDREKGLYKALLWRRRLPTVAGGVGLRGWMGPLAGVPVTLEIRRPGEAAALQTETVHLSAAGEFSLPIVWPPGVYDVTVKGDRWLRAILRNVTVTEAGASGLEFGDLIPGDVSDDNSIDLADFLLLASAYEADPPTEPRADLNGDGAVNEADFLLLAQHFGESGAP